MPALSTWAPLVSGRAADRMRTSVDEIARALRRPPPPTDKDPHAAAALMAREPGLALFYAYLARVAPRAGHVARASRLLARAAADVPHNSHRPNLAFGFAGTAWAIEHLGAAGTGDDDANLDIDAALTEHVASAPSISPDLQLGAAGLGVYALERLPRPSGARLLAAVVDRLQRDALESRAGISWRTPQQFVTHRDWRKVPEGLTQPGVFNGVAGIVGVLAAATAWNVEHARAARLLQGGLDWLWAQRASGLWNATPHRQQCWSSGSLGIAAVLHAAGRLIGDPRCGRRALESARGALALQGRAFVPRDAAFARGLAGSAHMCMRLFQATGDERFAAAARTRLSTLLRRRRPGLGMAGWRFYSATWQPGFLGQEDYPTGWIGLPGLSNGIAGIGLTLLSATSALEPAWDRLFLLSHRRPSPG